MGRNGLLPKAMAFVHPRFKTPIWAITLGVGIQIAFTLVSSINIAVTATGFLYLLTFIFTMIAFFLSRKRITQKDQENQFLVPFYPVIPLLALLISVSLLIPVGKTGLLTGLIWLLIGLGIYLLRKRSIIKTVNITMK
ncbi:amino acid permease C-terminal domain-containing protein [Desulfitobacterium sp. Sab5]|uniref:amino acid permease C-terminal domain-containing protein n=1 Tax=Desulfitobacterium nosdiversum TaxID=3375356 RepID=UPI003CE7F696